MTVGYVQQTWTDGSTPVDSSHMSHIEAGLGLLDSGKVDTNSVVATGSNLLTNRLISTDAQYALQIRGEGKIIWGPGGAAGADTMLLRIGAKQLSVGQGGWPCALNILSDTTLWPFTLYDNAAQSYPFLYIDINGRINWGPKSVATDTNLYRSAVNTLRSDGNFQMGGFLSMVGGAPIYSRAGSLGAFILNVSVNADANDRFTLGNDGKMNWGPGTAATDTDLFRAGAATLKTDGSLIAAQGFNAAGMAAAGSSALQTSVAGDTNPRLNVQAGGTILWGPGNAATDTDLYRYGAASLGTDGKLVKFSTVATDVAFATAGATTDGNFTWYTRKDGQMWWGAGAASAVDTNLYRTAANQLKTDGVFGSGLQIFGSWGVVNGQVRVGDIGGYAGLQFGTAADTNLYRTSASVLSTDSVLCKSNYGVAVGNAGSVNKRVQGGVIAGTTDASGQLTVTFPVAFGATPDTVVAMNGNQGQAAFQCDIAPGNISSTIARVRAVTISGGNWSALANTTVTINWFAIGNY